MASSGVVPGAESPDGEPGGVDGMQFELLSKLPLAPRGASHRALAREGEAGPVPRITARDKMMVLFLWARSGLPATQFAPLVGKTSLTIRAWLRRFLEEGKRGAPKGSRLPAHTRQAILLMKEGAIVQGEDRIHNRLANLGLSTAPDLTADIPGSGVRPRP